MNYLKGGSVRYLILTIFLLSGFFIFTKPVSAIYATTTNPHYTNGYDFKDVNGQFIEDSNYWFDGEHYRFSFTPTRDFYTVFYHYGDRIANNHFYFTYFTASYFFLAGGGGGSGGYFVENMDDLNNYQAGDSIFFLWEAGHRYDSYLVDGDIAGTGLSDDNFFLNWHFKDNPDDRLRPTSSHIKFMTRYVDYINNSHPRNYINYDYEPEDSKLDPVIIVPGILGSWNFGGGWQLDPIFNTYDNLWAALKLAGYEEGVNLFAFPYNWRLSNVYSAMELKSKIDEVKVICDCDKVDIVAHSMGGLVARAYVEMGNYDNDIDQLIFLATPHRGSPKAYLMWEGGEFGMNQFDLLKNRIFKVESEFNGYGSVYDYVRELPMKSIEETLPIYSYLKDKDLNGDWQIRDYSDSHPHNLFLELLNEPSQLIKLDNIDITNVIASNGNTTIDYLNVIDKDFINGEWQHGYPDGFYNVFGEHGIEYGAGDDTVPYKSSGGFNNLDDVIVSSSHNSVVTDAQKLIIKELTGNEPEVEVRKNIFSKYLMIRIFSPADFVVTSPDGYRVGKDFINNQIINEIAGAFYSGFNGGPEFVLIPDPIAGEYSIELQGTGEGKYRLSASLIDDNQAIDSEYSGFISLYDEDDYKISLESESLSDLNPDITTTSQLIEEIEEMYQKTWLNHFGSKTALVSQLVNGFKNAKQFEQLNKFVDNMLEKQRLNNQAYAIIKTALINIKNNL